MVVAPLCWGAGISPGGLWFPVSCMPLRGPRSLLIGWVQWVSEISVLAEVLKIAEVFLHEREILFLVKGALEEVAHEINLQ